MNRRVAFILTLIVLTSAPVLAQNGGFAGASMRVGFGPRGLGMGNAMTSVTSQGVYPYYNPALAAAQVDNKQFDLSVASLSFDRQLQTLSASLPLPPKAGLTFYFTHAGVSNIDGRTQSGFHTEFLSTDEYQLAAAFGIRLSNYVYAGMGFKLNVSDLDDDLDRENNIGLDIGILARPTQNLNIAITLQDMISEYTFNSADVFGLNQAQNVTNRFPRRLKFAGAWQETKWTVTSEFEVRIQQSEIIETDVFLFDGQPGFIESSSDINTSSTLWRLGGAYDIHERLTIRSGYRLTDLSENGSNSFSAGFSLHLPFDKLSPSIDYAFVIEPYQVANIHVFGLRFNL